MDQVTIIFQIFLDQTLVFNKIKKMAMPFHPFPTIFPNHFDSSFQTIRVQSEILHKAGQQYPLASQVQEMYRTQMEELLGGKSRVCLQAYVEAVVFQKSK